MGETWHGGGTLNSITSQARLWKEHFLLPPSLNLFCSLTREQETPPTTHTHMRVHTLFHAFSECHHSSLCAHSDPFWLKSTQGPSVWDAGAPLHLSSSSRLRRSADGILTHLSAFGSGSLAACVFVGFSLLSPSPLPAPPPPPPPRPSISLLSAHRASLCLPLPLPVTCSLLASSSFSSSLCPPLLHTHSRPRPSFRQRDRSGRADGRTVDRQ